MIDRLELTMWRPLEIIMLVAALVLAGGVAVSAAVAGERCDEERPREIFEALEAIDTEGENRLQIRLQDLAEQERWTQGDWEQFTLSLADSPAVNEREDQRSALMAQVFAVLAKPPVDCVRLDELEAEVLNLERALWDDSLERVERRLQRNVAPDAL